MKVEYRVLAQTIAALTQGEDDVVSLMATVACEVHHADDRFDWTGFYRVVGPELLKIGPYQGGHGCLVIPFSRGVCGAAARTGQVQLVPDVEIFAGHIACSSSTRSEISIAILRQGRGAFASRARMFATRSSCPRLILYWCRALDSMCKATDWGMAAATMIDCWRTDIPARR